MKLPRRAFLHLAAGAAALPAVSHVAIAQTYPTRPVRIIVPFPVGAPNDILARLIGQWLSERLGQPFVIENRAGGGGSVGTEAVVKAQPDGYTLLTVAASTAISGLYYKLNFNFIRDIAPVASMIRQPIAVVVDDDPPFPAKTIPELIAYAKANPRKIKMVSTFGTVAHAAGELFKMMAGVNIDHVSNSGREPVVNFTSLALRLDLIRAGKLRALAVTSATRVEAMPNIPSMSEFVPGYEASDWHGVGAPKDTPAEIIDRLNKEINAGLADPKIKARLADMAGSVLAGSPADFGKFIATETEKWAKVTRFAGIRPT
jgi:tripartite-type tricarboxylate transporter receptor subunit TctC